MRSQRTLEKLQIAATTDPDILCDRSQIEETIGSDPKYLEEILNLTKGDLIRLERLGFAFKARYVTNSGKGPHRIRWIIFKEAVGE